jgi:uncharacterized membrane protein
MKNPLIYMFGFCLLLAFLIPSYWNLIGFLKIFFYLGIGFVVGYNLRQILGKENAC